MAEEFDFDTPEEGHIDEASLMLYIDGELTSSAADAIAKHLSQCPACRQEYADLREASYLYSCFQTSSDGSLPAPPRNWQGFKARLSEEPLTTPAVKHWGLWNRFANAIRRIDMSYALPWGLAAAAAVIGFLYLHLPARHPLSVEEILDSTRRVAAASVTSDSPVEYQRLKLVDSAEPEASLTVKLWRDQQRNRIRQDANGWSYVTTGGVASGKASNDGQSEPPRLLHDVQSTLESNHLPWDAPLSAETFSTWLQLPGRKHEAVARERLDGGGEAYRLTAEALDPAPLSPQATPSIRVMELLVRAADWHAISERLTVASRSGTHTYEIAELEYRLIPLNQLEGNIFGGIEGGNGAVRDAGSPAVPATERKLSPDELAIEALDRLDRIDALAQDEVLVTWAAPGRLEIRGTVRSKTRKAEVLSALGSFAADPSIKVDLFSASETTAEKASTLTHPVEVQDVEVLLNESAGVPEVRRYMATYRHLSGSDLDQAAERFATDAVAHSTEAQLHAQALKHILEVASLTNETEVASGTRAKWCALIARHAQVSQREIHLLEQQLSPVFPNAAAKVKGPANTSSHDDLRTDAARLLDLTTESDKILWRTLSSNSTKSEQIGLTDSRFWLMLKEEDFLAAHLIERAHHL